MGRKRGPGEGAGELDAGLGLVPTPGAIDPAAFPFPGLPAGLPPPTPAVPVANPAAGLPTLPPGVGPTVVPPKGPGFPPAGLLPPGLAVPGPPGLAMPTLGALQQILPGVAPPQPGLPPCLGGAKMPPPAPGLGLGGLPVLPGMAPPPAMPPPGSLDTEALAQLRFQQVASEYEQIKSAGIDPQVAELAEYHGLDERVTRLLDEEMKKRKDTFESDMQALWVGLERAKNPAGMLMMKLKDMKAGTFKGMSALDKKIEDFAKRNRLDAQAAVRLAEVLQNRDDVDGDLAKLQKHLERSNKPSSLVMMMLLGLCHQLLEGILVRRGTEVAAGREEAETKPEAAAMTGTVVEWDSSGLACLSGEAKEAKAQRARPRATKAEAALGLPAKPPVGSASQTRSLAGDLPVCWETGDGELDVSMPGRRVRAVPFPKSSKAFVTSSFRRQAARLAKQKAPVLGAFQDHATKPQFAKTLLAPGPQLSSCAVVRWKACRWLAAGAGNQVVTRGLALKSMEESCCLKDGAEKDILASWANSFWDEHASSFALDPLDGVSLFRTSRDATELAQDALARASAHLGPSPGRSLAEQQAYCRSLMRSRNESRLTSPASCSVGGSGASERDAVDMLDAETRLRHLKRSFAVSADEVAARLEDLRRRPVWDAYAELTHEVEESSSSRPQSSMTNQSWTDVPAKPRQSRRKRTDSDTSSHQTQDLRLSHVEMPTTAEEVRFLCLGASLNMMPYKRLQPLARLEDDVYDNGPNDSYDEVSQREELLRAVKKLNTYRWFCRLPPVVVDEDATELCEFLNESMVSRKPVFVKESHSLTRRVSDLGDQLGGFMANSGHAMILHKAGSLISAIDVGFDPRSTMPVVPLLPAQLPKLRPQDRAARPNWHPELSDDCQATARRSVVYLFLLPRARARKTPPGCNTARERPELSCSLWPLQAATEVQPVSLQNLPDSLAGYRTMWEILDKLGGGTKQDARNAPSRASRGKSLQMPRLGSFAHSRPSHVVSPALPSLQVPGPAAFTQEGAPLFRTRVLFPFDILLDGIGNEPTPEGLREEAKRLCSLRGSCKDCKDRKELVQAWSLLLSRAQAEALDRAGIPHPAILIPITDEQRNFWHHFAAGVEFLPGDDLEEDVLVAISEEWTAVATIGEALRAWLSLKASEVGAQDPPLPKRSITIYILGPSPSLEYERGLKDLHHKLLACLLGLEGPSSSPPFLHLVFCGPDVPSTIHAQAWKDGRLHVEHWKRHWHDLQKENLQSVDLIVAMNAGTSVAPYRKLWLPTLMAIAKLEDCLLWFTGYTLPEVAETQKDVNESCPQAVVLHCDAGRSSTLAGTDRVELGRGTLYFVVLGGMRLRSWVRDFHSLQFDSPAARACTWNVGEMAKTHPGLSCDCRMSAAGPLATCNLKAYHRDGILPQFPQANRSTAGGATPFLYSLANTT
ncbi:unnamed protein product, partial [Symbiodinium sp. CCMP2456]